ncbi:ABC transporter substrate-binding protein [Glycomyces scopariae]|uniref:Monosaccharide ABC transporter substrate-binding protein, CUT2 family n=1 Tax=Glycomyces sambucus TaxID=380244 RepID=A0A1G9FRG9_9ACTN|nr:ABC transporter substrate-binding protein [Glycomyces sambucus]SDK91008.1 monosaccharide ABC transporter substrate-binding protein, CUT2 family [Glycomyces sambucus]
MMKRRAVLAAAPGAALLLAGCGDDATEGLDPDKPYVALVSKGFQHQFWQAVQEGAEQAAEEFGVEITFEGPESESEVAQQIDMLQTALDRNPDAIGFAALDSQASAPLMTEAESRGVPVIAFDSGVDSDVPVTTASTDNLAAAALAAERMVELIGGAGKVALVVHDQTSVTGVDRRDGFTKYIEENAPDVEIVDVQYGAGDQLESTNIATAIIEGNPDLAGIYGANEGSAIGVVNAVQELDRVGEIVVIGFDSGQAQMDAIRGGVMAGAITQNPVGIGYETVKAAAAAINGEDLPETIDTGFYWYDATNIDDAEIQAVLYE